MFHPDALIANSTLSVFCFSDEGEPNDPAIVFYYSCSPSCLFAFSILHLCFDPSLFDMVSVLLFISSKRVWVNLPDLSVALKTVSVGTLFSSTIHWPLFVFRTPIIFNCHSVTSFSIAQLGVSWNVFLFFILCFTTGFSKMRYRLSFFVFKLVLVTKPTCALAAGWGPHWSAPSSSLPLWSGDSWVSFTELSDGWHDHGKTPFNPPHCLQLEKQTERGTEKKEWSYFLLFVWFWNSRRVTVWLQRFNHYCLFFRAWN